MAAEAENPADKQQAEAAKRKDRKVVLAPTANAGGTKRKRRSYESCTREVLLEETRVYGVIDRDNMAKPQLIAALKQF